MKKLLLFYSYIVLLIGCNDTAKPKPVADPNVVKNFADSFPSWLNEPHTDVDSSEIAFQEEIAKYEKWHEKIDSVEKQLDKKIPKMIPIKEAFYKHFLGKIGTKNAKLELSASVYGRLQGGFRYDNSFEVSEVWADGNEKKGVIVLNFPEATMLTNRDYPISHLRGFLDLELGIFKGYALNDSTLKPIAFEFKESYDDGALPMIYKHLSREGKIAKQPNRFELSRHFAAPSVNSDVSEFLKNAIIRDIKMKNQYYFYSENEHFDIEKFRKKLPNFTDFDSTFTYLSNLHFKTWEKSLKANFRETPTEQKGKLSFYGREPRTSDNSSIIFNSDKLLVFDLITRTMDGESYGLMVSTVVEYDLETKKELTEKDVFKPNYDKNIMYQAMNKHYKFGDYSRNAANFYSYERYVFSYFTDKAIVFCGPGNHGWMYNRYSLPIEDLKPILKKSFLDKYFKPTLK